MSRSAADSPEPGRVTGTHVYSYSKCPHAVTLDFHEDRARRRPPTEIEEFVLRRGRELEEVLTADLGYTEPRYPDRDFEAGAAATLELMRAGAPGLLQAVLLGENALGIADLLRIEAGESMLGPHHYVVGDIKSSRRARGDQVLQVMFYSRLLAVVQGRAPAYGYLVLRNGNEERFACSDYDTVLDDLLKQIQASRLEPSRTRPFYGPACRSCRWSDVCVPALQAADDLSLLQGMTRGLRTTLETAGLRTCESLHGLRSVESVSRRTHIESAALRRLRGAATARAAGRPTLEPSATQVRPEDIAVLHLLGDPFADRVHWIGLRHPATPTGTLLSARPAQRADELASLHRLLEQLPARTPLWHYGSSARRWIEEISWRQREGRAIERRLVDLRPRLRGIASCPTPVFGLDDHVRALLERDPHRAGDAAAVGLWVDRGDAALHLARKGESDLDDLCALVALLADAVPQRG